jgi:hypothetical protein
MRKGLLVGVLAMLCVAGSTVPAAAQTNTHGPDDAVGLGADSADGTIFKSLNATSNHFAVRYQCTDPTATSTTISVAITDCCVEGDLWGAVVYKGTKAALFRSTGNQNSTPGGAAPYAPGSYSANATISTKVKKVDVIGTLRSSIADCSLPFPFCQPGPYTGLPAGGTLRIITNGGGPVCERKQVLGGTAGL